MTSGIDIVQAFATFLSRNIGLHFGKERLPELEQRLSALSRKDGRSLNDYLVRLMSAPLSREQQDSLVRALAIGETYFLRDPKSYRILEEIILPRLVEARGSGEKSLTILSAGCSTGEEPYSIAILLSRALPDLSRWKVNLLATDLNPEALERGRRGIYGTWSFRNAPQWLFDYFTRRDDGRFEICEEIRSMVRFEQMNLVREAVQEFFPDGIDVIFCRNVLLYFDSAAIASTMQKFHGALRENGWLFVGPTEVDHHSFDGFSCSQHDGALVLRKVAGEPFGAPPQKRRQYLDAAPPGPAAAASAPPAVAPLPRAAVTAAAPVSVPHSPAGLSSLGERTSGESGDSIGSGYQEAVGLYQAALYQEAAELALASPAGADQGAALTLAARSFANLGRFSEARECCEKAIGLEKLSAPNHYLLSIILEQQGDVGGAMQSLKRALFIDHDFLLAYFALGNLCRRRGEQKESERNFSTALRLLERRHPHEVLPEADGMTAGRLAEMIRGVTAG